MTLTEEQREAIRAVSDLPRAIGCTRCHNYIQKNYSNQFAVLRSMIDSSGTVEPTGGFDLGRARGLRDFLQDDCAEVGDVWGEMIAEIERLRAENLELQVAVFGPDGIRANQACIIADQAARISDLEIEITGLKADLEQSEEIKRLKDELENYGDHYACLLISKDAQIKELEDALVEERARWCSRENTGAQLSQAGDQFQKRCRRSARLQLQAEGKIGSSDHSSDVTKRVWKITEERVAALVAMSSLRTDVDCPQCDAWLHFSDIAEHAPVLRAMLTEAE